ncbi:hypothetical protein JK364_45925 [Streptomyces sp. 110]|uniref:Uncharacterized protein n=1 Tax=Streptomyces endocoffeicus TaxID=2898945 RepID=A0ABS1Q4K4_9ACTN|nr:hypothetical protein [Streptomyces endocoffeicus]MBL1119618.1 hypothetical protein [Streptomyces endocoffeicus]
MSEVFPGDGDVKVIFAAAFLKGGPGQSVGSPTGSTPNCDAPATPGRIKYRTYGWRQSAMWLFSRARPNYAQAPVVWAELETIAQAKQCGRHDPGTDDLLLAVLAAYEVAQQYPHLARPPGDGYNGGRLLAEADVRYHDAHHLAQLTDLGLDPHHLRWYVPTLPDDTAAMLRSVFPGPDNRATRLLTTVSVDVSQLRGD